MAAPICHVAPLLVRRIAHLRCAEHDPRQSGKTLLLFLNQEFRVTDDVDKKDVPDFKAEIVVRFRHSFVYTEGERVGDLFSAAE